jgi:hypothetical protein
MRYLWDGSVEILGLFLNVHVESLAGWTLGGLGGQLALLKEQGQQGEQRVPEIESKHHFTTVPGSLDIKGGRKIPSRFHLCLVKDGTVFALFV